MRSGSSPKESRRATRSTTDAPPPWYNARLNIKQTRRDMPIVPSIVRALALLLASASALALETPIPNPPSVPAESYILLDHHSSRVLAELDADVRMEPASITKLMTAYVVDKALRDGDISLEDNVLVSERAWRTGGSRMFIEVGTQVSVSNLLRGLIIQSGNDAAVALAEHVAGSEEGFAALMNHYAEQLGLTNTHFVNSTGLPDAEHYSTARDIASLSSALITEFPGSYGLNAEREFEFNGIKQYNRNRLLWRDESVDGLKTGWTRTAGYCLAASAVRGDQRLISVVLGSPNDKSRLSATQTLLAYGYRFYTTRKLYDAGEALTDTRVWKGENSQLALGLGRALYVTVPRGRYKDLTATMSVHPSVEAPVASGTELGMVQVALDDRIVTEIPLVALADVAEAGLVGRVTDQAIMMFQSLFE